MINLDCPHCRQKLTFDNPFAGTKARCPQCDGVIRVPVDIQPDLPPAPIQSRSTARPVRSIWRWRRANASPVKRLGIAFWVYWPVFKYLLPALLVLSILAAISYRVYGKYFRDRWEADNYPVLAQEYHQALDLQQHGQLDESVALYTSIVGTLMQRAQKNPLQSGKLIDLQTNAAKDLEDARLLLQARDAGEQAQLARDRQLRIEEFQRRQRRISTVAQPMPVPGRPAHSVTNLADEHVVAAMLRGADALLAILTTSVPEKPSPGISETNDDGKLLLGVYALLVIDRALDEPRFHFSSTEMSNLVKYAVDLRTDMTYTLAMQANILALLPPRPEYVSALKTVRGQLMSNMHTDGSYGYGAGLDPGHHYGGPTWWDTSNSQYALLGMWACDDAGATAPRQFWVLADYWWHHHQLHDGGWSYQGNPGSTATMTAAGVASLFVTTDKLSLGAPLNSIPDPESDAGLKWLTDDLDRDRSAVGNNLYLAYGIERIGLASGLKFFGQTDWYRDGVASILQTQGPDGIWHYNDDPKGMIGTSFALLFLARGRFPVVFNKLQYNGPWNARPLDDAHFTRWLSKKTERDLNWQIVDINTDPDDWLDAPVLLITGHDDPKFTDEQIDKLRDFTEGGGLIFSTADGNDKTFTDAILHKYAPAIVSNQFKMRQLPADHYLFTLDYKPPKGDVPVMYGLSNGIREMWIHSPQDMGADWQRYATAAQDNWEIPANIYFYVSGRTSLRSKLQPLAVPDDDSVPVQTWKLAEIAYSGNFDPEPAAWPRFCRLAKLNHKTQINMDDVPFDQLDPVKNPIAHITGTAGFNLSAPEQAALRAYLEGGGFLIADAAGGSEAFGQAFKDAIAKVLPAAKLNEVDTTMYPVTTGRFAAGESLTNLESRRFCRIGDNRARELGVYELKIKGRPAVLFFEGDITSGLLGTNTWGILGYTPATCETLAWNAVAYAETVAANASKP